MHKAFTRIEANYLKALRKERKATKELTDVPASFDLAEANREIFFEEIGTLPEQTMLTGAMQAQSLGLAVDFDLVNTQVLDSVATYKNSWWSELNFKTQENLRSAIATNISTGASHRDLVKSLESTFGKVRADMIASTETTRLYAEGNRQGYASAGIGEVEFQTVRDSAVDPKCDALDGKVWSLNAEEAIPPIHVRCRCWLAPVTDEGETLNTVQEPVPSSDAALIENASLEDVGEAFERWATESGQMIDILEGVTPGFSSYGSRYTAEQLTMLERQAKLINALANQSRTKQFIMYRGESYTTTEEILSLYRVGEKVSRNRLLSVSPDAKVAETYAGMEHPHQVVLQFVSAEGHQGTWADIASRLDKVRATDAGSEFIFAHGATYEVAGVIEPSKGTPFWQIFLQK